LFECFNFLLSVLFLIPNSEETGDILLNSNP
jgi:hypothetical protein